MNPEQPRPAPSCPFCASKDAEVISLFGTQAVTLQYRCRSCGSIYEALKYAAADAAEKGVDSPARHRGGAGGA